ncbi:hypothetical protein HS088_TW22G00222 [Tripterygium wilfordii]|uniref:Uncharacterized protein n=1 Tax=Tripterygium wilfordii TaxID=458696 RepID=A0A7J7BXE2_TRIWF|nr:hypothetical protein HS088_TW22G00222 [Tripterygium wilfordii]
MSNKGYLSLRPNGDSTMVGSSSIALLQERFRELQRVKKDREKKELLRLYTGSELVRPSVLYDQHTKLGYHQQEVMFLPSKPALVDSLSLGLKLQSNRADFQVRNGTSLTNSRPSVVNSSKEFCFDSSDVDTTLHL